VTWRTSHRAGPVHGARFVWANLQGDRLMTGKQNGAQSRNEIGTISDAELDHVTGGDKATTTTTKDTKTTPPKPIVFTLEQVLVSSY
jgi:hypothetical protein